MARKTFISYKYSEACKLRDEILKALGEEAMYYQGETSDSPDLTDDKTETIKKKLTDMMYNTSVTIVILSPNIIKSKWVDWELEYSLKEISRKDRKSKTNGIVAVIMKYNNSYEWLIKTGTNCHGNNTISFYEKKLYPIINKNHFNSNPEKWHCDKCKTYDSFLGSYISYVKEDDFLNDPTLYIENAYDKSEKTSEYNLIKLK